MTKKKTGKRITVRLSEEMARWLARHAATTGDNISDAIRRAVVCYRGF